MRYQDDPNKDPEAFNGRREHYAARQSIMRDLQTLQNLGDLYFNVEEHTVDIYYKGGSPE